MKTLIAYYSNSGNNELLAMEIQARTGADIFKIEETRKRTKLRTFLDVTFGRLPEIKDKVLTENYDRFILIAPIWMGQIASPLRTFLIRHQDEIFHYRFISLCATAPGQRQKLTLELTPLIRVKPDRITELSIKKLMSPEDAVDPKKVLAYRMKTDEVRAFEKEIEEFLAERQVPKGQESRSREQEVRT